MNAQNKPRVGLLFIFDIIAIVIAVGANLVVSHVSGAALPRDLLTIVLFMTGVRFLVMAAGDLTGATRKIWRATLFAILAEAIVIGIEYLMAYGLASRFLMLTAITDIVLITVAHIIWSKRFAQNDAPLKTAADDASKQQEDESSNDQKVNWMLRGSVFEDETTADISEAIAKARAETADDDEARPAAEETSEIDFDLDALDEQAPEEAPFEAEPSEQPSETASDDEPAFEGMDGMFDAVEDDTAPAQTAEATMEEDGEPAFDDLFIEDDTAEAIQPAGETVEESQPAPPDKADSEEAAPSAAKPQPSWENFSDVERALGRFIDDISDSTANDDTGFAADAETLRNTLDDLPAITEDKDVLRAGKKLRKEIAFVTKRKHLDNTVIDYLVTLTQRINEHLDATDSEPVKVSTAPELPPAPEAAQEAKASPEAAKPEKQPKTVTANRVPNHKSPVKLSDGEVILDSGDSEIIIDAETLEMIREYMKEHENEDAAS